MKISLAGLVRGGTDGARDDDLAIITVGAVARMDEATMENQRTPRFSWSTTGRFGRWSSLLCRERLSN